MPTAAPRPCTYPGCGTLVQGSSRCSLHQVEAWTKRPDAPKRRTGRRLQADRARLFRESPLCVECQRAGVVRAATERDHIIPLAEGGTDDDSNIQGLCKEHHAAKSKREAARGVGRIGERQGGGSKVCAPAPGNRPVPQIFSRAHYEGGGGS